MARERIYISDERKMQLTVDAIEIILNETMSNEEKTEQVKNLIDLGADSLIPAKSGSTLFHFVIFFGFREVFDLIVNNAERDGILKELIMAKTYVGKDTSLNIASSRTDRIDMLKTIMDKAEEKGFLKELLMVKNRINESILNISARTGPLEKVEYLIEKMSKYDILSEYVLLQNIFKETAINNAIIEGKTDIVNLLLEKAEEFGAIENIFMSLDINSCHILQIGIIKNQLEIVQSIISKAQKYNILQKMISHENHFQENILHLAGKVSDASIFELILNHLEEFDLVKKMLFHKNKAFETPLAEAISAKSLQNVELILNKAIEKGFLLELLTSDIKNRSYLALSIYSFEIVEMILNKASDEGILEQLLKNELLYKNPAIFRAAKLCDGWLVTREIPTHNFIKVVDIILDKIEIVGILKESLFDTNNISDTVKLIYSQEEGTFALGKKIIEKARDNGFLWNLLTTNISDYSSEKIPLDDFIQSQSCERIEFLLQCIEDAGIFDDILSYCNDRFYNFLHSYIRIFTVDKLELFLNKIGNLGKLEENILNFKPLNDGLTHIAINAGLESDIIEAIMKIALNFGILDKIKQTTIRGETLFHHITRLNLTAEGNQDYEKYIDICMKYGVDFSAINIHGQSALDISQNPRIKEKYLKFERAYPTIKLFLDKGLSKIKLTDEEKSSFSELVRSDEADEKRPMLKYIKDQVIIEIKNAISKDFTNEAINLLELVKETCLEIIPKDKIKEYETMIFHYNQIKGWEFGKNFEKKSSSILPEAIIEKIGLFLNFNDSKQITKNSSISLLIKKYRDSLLKLDYESTTKIYEKIEKFYLGTYKLELTERVTEIVESHEEATDSEAAEEASEALVALIIEQDVQQEDAQVVGIAGAGAGVWE